MQTAPRNRIDNASIDIDSIVDTIIAKNAEKVKLERENKEFIQRKIILASCSIVLTIICFGLGLYFFNIAAALFVKLEGQFKIATATILGVLTTLFLLIMSGSYLQMFIDTIKELEKIRKSKSEVRE